MVTALELLTSLAMEANMPFARPDLSLQSCNGRDWLVYRGLVLYLYCIPIPIILLDMRVFLVYTCVYQCECCTLVATEDRDGGDDVRQRLRRCC